MPRGSRNDGPGAAAGRLVPKRAVEQGYQRVRQKAATANPEQLSRPTTNPVTKETLPTLKEMVAFVLSGHMGVHLGQLSSWRRLIGLPAQF